MDYPTNVSKNLKVTLDQAARLDVVLTRLYVVAWVCCESGGIEKALDLT